MMMRLAYSISVGLVGLAAWAVVPAARADEPMPDTATPVDAATVTTDELLLFEDMPTVISAARRAQPINLSAVSVGLLDAPMIHYSGLTNVAEVLNFTPGVDVQRVDRNHYIVGVHGLMHQQTDRTLVLINGRNAMNPVFGSTNWVDLPLIMEDVERIEIVRGPGGAAWGANALNGVINIITKDPADTLGWMASSTFNEYGDTYNQFRWGAQRGDWQWRISGSYNDVESSDEAIAHDDFVSHDDARRSVVDAEAHYHVNHDTQWRFGVAAIHEEAGPYHFNSFTGADDNTKDAARYFVRLEHDLDDDESMYLQWSGRAQHVDDATVMNYRMIENDLEGQYAFSLNERHRLTLGGNARMIHLDQVADNPFQYMFEDEPFEEYWVGLFAIDRWQATDRLAFEGQGRIDYYSGSDTDWSARLAALYALDDQQHHVLRVAGAKAFRTISPGLRETSSVRAYLPSPPFAPNTPVVSLLQPDHVDNEQVYALEGGYTGRLSEELTFRADAYLHRYEDISGYDLVVIPPASVQLDLNNGGGGDAYGVDTSLEWRPGRASVMLWYSYNAFNTDKSFQDTRSFEPAAHKAGLNLLWYVTDDDTLALNYKYTTECDTLVLPGVSQPTPDFHRLDLTLSHKLFKGRGELTVGVTDLLDQTDVAIQPIGNAEVHDTPGRTFFGRVQLNF